jgi:hypothetical protein
MDASNNIRSREERIGTLALQTQRDGTMVSALTKPA